MKSNFSDIGLAKLCGWFGITRQAYYQNSWAGITWAIGEELIIKEVKEIRKRHGKMGTRKLYEKLHFFLADHNIKMGRDALFSLLSANHLLVRRRKRYIQTTQSFHWLRKYPNLIRGFTPTGINQLWVSDITYWKVNDIPVYLSFITDAYSHKIVGYNLGQTLETLESLQALRMALSALGAESHSQLIHHSDRGLQYCSHSYVELLEKYSIQISMTENGDPLENAVAERLNGIIKGEYLEELDCNSPQEAKRRLKKAVELYNNERSHMSIGYLTPNQVHHSKQSIQTERRWKNYYRRKPMDANPVQDYSQNETQYQENLIS